MDFENMTGDERFAELDRLAKQIFGTNRWKSAFAQRYGIRPATLTSWRQRGSTPVWALQAASDGLSAKAMTELRRHVNQNT